VSVYDPGDFWLLLGLLQVDQEDLHEVAEHGGDADLAAPKTHRPLQQRLQLPLLQQAHQSLEELLVGELVPDRPAQQVVEQHQQTDQPPRREVGLRGQAANQLADLHLQLLLLYRAHRLLQLLRVFLLQAQQQSVEEEESGVIKPHRMAAVVRALNLAHLLQLVRLAVAQKFAQSLEKLLVSLHLLDYSREKEGIFQRNQLLQYHQGPKSIEQALGNVSEFEHEHGEVLL